MTIKSELESNMYVFRHRFSAIKWLGCGKGSSWTEFAM